MPRLFTAIELPDDVREDVALLRQPVPGAQWIDPGNLHITLRFAGDIDNRVADDFAEELSRIDIDVFEIALEGLGTFGGADPRTLWAGLARCAALDSLARAHEKAARSAGLAPETRAFKPHVTLARLRHAREDALVRVLQRRALFRTAPFVVERFVLMSSRPKVGGGPYVVEEAFPLRGAHGGNYVTDRQPY
jgi:2'-5' RNA ligase